MEANLALCNLVSRGYTMAAARKKLSLDKPAKQESEPTSDGLKAVEDMDVQELRDEIKELGGRFAPNTGVKRLRETLAELREGGVEEASELEEGEEEEGEEEIL